MATQLEGRRVDAYMGLRQFIVERMKRAEDRTELLRLIEMALTTQERMTAQKIQAHLQATYKI